MEYGININYFTNSISLAEAAKLISKAGFTKLDYTPPLLEDTWESDMKEALKIFKDNGLSVHQTHAPFNRYGQYGNRFILCMDRCMDATEYLGAEYIAVHGDEFDFDQMVFSPGAALDYNHELFLPYVARGEKSGFKLAFETVFEDRPDRRRYTSQADELMTLIRSFENDCAVCCWDFGHAHVSFQDKAPEYIRQFGQLIQCTHLHDNTGKDSHQLPMTGDINWSPVMASFKEIGYDSVMSIEYAHGNIPSHLTEAFIDLTYKTAVHLWNME